MHLCFVAAIEMQTQIKITQLKMTNFMCISTKKQNPWNLSFLYEFLQNDFASHLSPKSVSMDVHHFDFFFVLIQVSINLKEFSHFHWEGDLHRIFSHPNLKLQMRWSKYLYKHNQMRAPRYPPPECFRRWVVSCNITMFRRNFLFLTRTWGGARPDRTDARAA